MISIVGDGSVEKPNLVAIGIVHASEADARVPVLADRGENAVNRAKGFFNKLKGRSHGASWILGQADRS